MDRGDLPSAEIHLRIAVDAARAAGADLPMARCAIALGDALRRMNRYEEAVPYYMESLTVSQVRDEVPLTVDSLRGLGYAHFRRGDVFSAQEYFTEGLELAIRSNDKLRQHRLRLALGDTCTEQGLYTKAIGHYAQALEQLATDPTAPPLERAHCQLNLAETYLRLRNPRKALAVLEPCQATMEELGNRRFMGWCLLHSGEARLLLGELTAARADLDGAEPLLERAKDRLGALSIGRVRALVTFAAAGPEAGVAAMTPVLAALRELDLPLYLLLALLELADRLAHGRSAALALPLLAEAAAIATGLDLTELSDRIALLQAKVEQSSREHHP